MNKNKGQLKIHHMVSMLCLIPLGAILTMAVVFVMEQPQGHYIWTAITGAAAIAWLISRDFIND